MDAAWSVPVRIDGWVDMEGRDPYTGETITLKVRLRHENLGTITSLDPDNGDALSYEVARSDGTVFVSGSLDSTDYINGAWETDIQAPSDPDILTVRWTASIDGAVGKARHSIRVLRS